MSRNVDKMSIDQLEIALMRKRAEAVDPKPVKPTRPVRPIEPAAFIKKVVAVYPLVEDKYSVTLGQLFEAAGVMSLQGVALTDIEVEYYSWGNSSYRVSAFVPNPNLEAEMRDYNEKLKAFEIEHAGFDAAMVAYKEAMRAWSMKHPELAPKALRALKLRNKNKISL
jgi:hypothetical protein